MSRILSLLLMLPFASLAQPREMFDWWIQAAQPPAAATSCDTVVFETGTAYDSLATEFGNVAARLRVWWTVTNTAPRTICSLAISIRTNSPTSSEIRASIWTFDGLNQTNLIAQVGGDSDPLASSALSGSLTTNVLTWSSNHPVIGASNHIVMLKISAASGNYTMPLHNPFLGNGFGMLYSGTDYAPTLMPTRRPWFILKAQ